MASQKSGSLKDCDGVRIGVFCFLASMNSLAWPADKEAYVRKERVEIPAFRGVLEGRTVDQGSAYIKMTENEKNFFLERYTQGTTPCLATMP